MSAVRAPKPHILVVETQATKDAHLVRDLENRFAVPGVFAAGDIHCRSVKRGASAVGEGSAAILLVHEYLDEN